MSTKARRRALAGSGALTLLATGIVVALISTSGSAVASVAPSPAVPQPVLTVLNADGTQFTTAPAAATVNVSASAAMADGAAEAPWPGSATGASLMETTALSEPQAPGSLVWLVSINPTMQVNRLGGPAPSDGTASPGAAANYFVVVVDAQDGHFVEAQDGYDAALALAQSARAGRSPHVVICGQRMPYQGGPRPSYTLSPHRTYTERLSGDSSMLTVVARGCKLGSQVSFQPRGVVATVARAYARHRQSEVAIALRGRRVGKTLLTVRQGGRVLGKVRYVVTRRSLRH